MFPSLNFLFIHDRTLFVLFWAGPIMVFCGNVARSLLAMAEEHLVTITDDFVAAMEFACFQQVCGHIHDFASNNIAMTLCDRRASERSIRTSKR
jgi:hypothetical protein